MKKDNLHWLAGIVDKGCSIRIVRQSDGYSLRVVISSTNKELIEKIKSLISFGSICFIHRKHIIKHFSRQNSKIRHRYGLVFCGDNAREFLLLVRPYLRTKTRKADICLAFSDAQKDRDKLIMYNLYRKSKTLADRK